MIKFSIIFVLFSINFAAIAQDVFLPSNIEIGTDDLDKSARIHEFIINKRIEVNYRGYESEINFRNGAKKYISAMQNPAKIQPITVGSEKSEVLNHFSSIAYESYETEFFDFYNKYLKQNPAMLGIDQNEAVRLIKIRSVLSYEMDKELWKKGWKFSYLWPVCQPPAPDFGK